MLGTILLVAITAAVAYAGYRIVTTYRAATGSPWERALATAKGSATILWQYVVAAGGLLMTGGSQLADAANMPEVREFIQAHLSPEIAGGALLVIAVVTVVARLRSLGSSKDDSE